MRKPKTIIRVSDDGTVKTVGGTFPLKKKEPNRLWHELGIEKVA